MTKVIRCINLLNRNSDRCIGQNELQPKTSIRCNTELVQAMSPNEYCYEFRKIQPFFRWDGKRMRSISYKGGWWEVVNHSILYNDDTTYGRIVDQPIENITRGLK